MKLQKKVFIVIILLFVLSFTLAQKYVVQYVVHFVTNDNLMSLAEVTGIMDTGKERTFYVPEICNGRFITLEPGTYSVKIAYPGLRGLRFQQQKVLHFNKG